MADRQTGAINFSNNFEVLFEGPLDARLSTPEYSQLTDSSIPFPYLGMLVSVTADTDSTKNGVYMLTSANSTLESSWTKIGSDPTEGGNPITAVEYLKADGTLTITLTHDGAGDINNPIEYDVTIDTYESALTDTSTNVPTSVGGFSTSDTVSTLNGLTQNQMWDKLLFPTVYPSGSGASTTLNNNAPVQNGCMEIQTILDIDLNSSANRGTLSNPSGPWAGNVIDAEITGPGGPYSPTITTPATIATVTVVDHEVVQGTTGNRWTLTTTFADGIDPLDSTGAVYLPAKFTQDTRTNPTQFEGVWPIYLGVGTGELDFTKFSLKKQSDSNITLAQNFPETASLNHRIAIPQSMVQGGEINIQLDAGQLGLQASYNANSNPGGWVKTNTVFDVHANALGVPYFLYTKSGSTGGSNTYIFNW